MSSLSRRCAECIRLGKQCEPAVPVVHFSGIDKAMEKLEREEMETEAAWEAANEIARQKQTKLKRLRQQKRFLKEREQRMFDKGLDDVEELERLEELEKAGELERALAECPTFSEFEGSGTLSPGALEWIAQGVSGFGDTAGGALDSS